MAICTKCGAIFPDFQIHQCKPENIPDKNTEIIKGVKIVLVDIGE